MPYGFLVRRHGAANNAGQKDSIMHEDYPLGNILAMFA
jgi:hypothetical protein